MMNAISRTSYEALIMYCLPVHGRKRVGERESRYTCSGVRNKCVDRHVVCSMGIVENLRWAHDKEGGPAECVGALVEEGALHGSVDS